jgi:nicotinamide mononucleotide transporter
MFKMDELTFEKNMNLMTVGIVIAAILTGLSYLVADWMGWAKLGDINYLEAFAVFTSYVCTWLCVHQTRWNYPIGVVTTLAYSILFWQTELYSLALFNLYLVFSLAYGYFRWGADIDTRPVTRLTPVAYLSYGVLALAIYGLLFIINSLLGHEMGWLDVVLAVASGVAQFMLDNKKLENWVVWILIDIASIWLYFETGLFIVAFQYVFFLLNAFYGYYEWNKTTKPIIDGYEESLKEIIFPEHARIPQQSAIFD